MNATSRLLAITTLSPLHIGCDEVFEPSTFVIADQLLHALNPEDIAAALDAGERATLLKLALADRADPIGPLQQFFKSKREKLTPLAHHVIDVAADIARDYETKAGQVQQRGGNGQPIYALFPINRTAFNPLDNRPYLPGSALKGAIRTAWLSKLNRGEAPREDERKAAAKLQQRLLGYAPGKFELDPFRHLAVADAHPAADGLPPPTRILYAVSKKKRPSERAPKGIHVFLETVREAQSDAFQSELRLDSRGGIRWAALCDACNDFYWPQLEAELDHPQFAPLLAAEWRAIVGALLGNELAELRRARQGFLLRVGKHSGAESVTLDGVRSIKILGPRINGKQTFEFRRNTTEKRFASANRAAINGLLPFGWIWIDSSDDAHRHLAIAVGERLRPYAAPIRAAHREKLDALDERKEARVRAAEQALQRLAAAAAEAEAEADARMARANALATMSLGRRRIEEFRTFLDKRAAELMGNKEALNADIHNRARQIANEALSAPDWRADEKTALADLLAEALPRLIAKMDKDQLKKLKLATLRAS